MCEFKMLIFIPRFFLNSYGISKELERQTHFMDKIIITIINRDLIYRKPQKQNHQIKKKNKGKHNKCCTKTILWSSIYLRSNSGRTMQILSNGWIEMYLFLSTIAVKEAAFEMNAKSVIICSVQVFSFQSIYVSKYIQNLYAGSSDDSFKSLLINEYYCFSKQTA